MPAKNGVTSALVVHSGWTGVDDILSGPDNFFAAFEPRADPKGLVEQLGERYEIARTNIKKWTVGLPIQAPLDAIQLILNKHPLPGDQLQEVKVRVGTQEAAIVNNREMPDICMQHLLAVLLIDKTVTFKSAHDRARMEDPAVKQVRKKITLIPDDGLDRLLPQRVAIVEVKMRWCNLHGACRRGRGTAQNPMTGEEVVAKCRDLVGPVLGAQTSSKLIDTLLALETVSDMRQLRTFLLRNT